MGEDPPEGTKACIGFRGWYDVSFGNGCYFNLVTVVVVALGLGTCVVWTSRVFVVVHSVHSPNTTTDNDGSRHDSTRHTNPSIVQCVLTKSFFSIGITRKSSIPMSSIISSIGVTTWIRGRQVWTIAVVEVVVASGKEPIVEGTRADGSIVGGTTLDGRW